MPIMNMGESPDEKAILEIQQNIVKYIVTCYTRATCSCLHQNSIMNNGKSQNEKAVLEIQPIANMF